MMRLERKLIIERTDKQANQTSYRGRKANLKNDAALNSHIDVRPFDVKRQFAGHIETGQTESALDSATVLA